MRIGPVLLDKASARRSLNVEHLIRLRREADAWRVNEALAKVEGGDQDIFGTPKLSKGLTKKARARRAEGAAVSTAGRRSTRFDQARVLDSTSHVLCSDLFCSCDLPLSDIERCTYRVQSLGGTDPAKRVFSPQNGDLNEFMALGNVAQQAPALEGRQ